MLQKTPKKIAVGIDLGTTYSTISYIDEFGQPISIENAKGQILTPSAVHLDDDAIIVGIDAVKTSHLAPKKYFECFKREMGGDKSFSCNGVKTPPEVLSALVLERLKEDVDQRFGPFRDAVITVPAYFDENRRQATVAAAELAGINVLEIINEPTAAALAFGVSQGPDCNKTVLVYDLGGGTFDVSILRIKGRDFTTIATDGDVQLGGKDFDERLVDYVAQEFENEHGIDPRRSSSHTSQLWRNVEETKRSLSNREQVAHVVSFSGKRHQVNVTREKFNELTADLVQRSCSTVEMLLRNAVMEWADIDEVLAVGGSSRIPAVRDMLKKVSGKQPNYSMDPDQVVGHGAALLCHSLINAEGAETLGLVDVNSRSLGVIGIDPKTKLKFNHIVIPKNTPLPFNAANIFVTGKEDQSSVIVPVVEGESLRPEECVSLGSCSVRDLPKGLPSGTEVRVYFSYDTSGRLAVSARVPTTRQSAATVIQRKNDSSNDSFSRWKERLTGKPESGETSHAEKLARLDSLFREIATSSSAGDPKTEKQINQLRLELDRMQTKQRQLQDNQFDSPSLSEAVQFSGLLSRLSKTIAFIESAIKSAELESGRRIVAEGKEGFAQAAIASEARKLIDQLKTTGPKK